MSVPPAPPAFTALDEISRGHTVQHVYRLMVRRSPGTVSALVDTALGAGATLEGLSAARYAEGHEVSLRLTGIDSPAARSLADRFSALAGVAFAQVEHLWSARSVSGA